ncbi:unnamed protein product [Polarella glacialis]|uniref:RING-type domain-containing protein n=1 Tax=Polarella glacialis TaxID=89957 RepID=A0A813LJF0_POLGL|nr:unnamed protein product [Polarella glacialis]CAE8730807.1 unnamed protein product [Polarella glacialis]
MEDAYIFCLTMFTILSSLVITIALLALRKALVDLRRDGTGEKEAYLATLSFTLAELAELAFPEVGVLDELMCTICLDDIAPEQPARKLSCGHAFHANCISSWWRCSLQINRDKVSCPSCRRDLEVCSSPGLKQQQPQLQLATVY